jgi:cobalt/nickel transport system permease protein
MHIPDGYLGPATYGSLWALVAPVWAFASRQVQRRVSASRVPYLAMGTVFSFLGMMFALPLPGGTTGHITGTALVAILLGPWAAIISISVALAIQALVLGDGGITALGANSFNIAVAGSLAASGVYRLLTGAAALFGPRREGSAGPAPVPYRMFAGGAAAYVAINAGALLAALELGLQPLLHGGGGGYFPYPLEVALPAVLLPHLTLVGALEAGVTALVLLFLHRTDTP